MKVTLKICYSTVYVFFRANVISPRNRSALWLYPSKRDVCLTESQLQGLKKKGRVRSCCPIKWDVRGTESELKGVKKVRPQIYNHGQKSLGQQCTIHVFCNSWVPHKTVHPFRNFLAVLPPPHPIQSWDSEKNLNTQVWGEGLGMCELKSVPEM